MARSNERNQIHRLIVIVQLLGGQIAPSRAASIVIRGNYQDRGRGVVYQP